MQIRYYIDPVTDLPHIYNHDVSEHEVEDILARPLQDIRDARILGLHWVKLKRDDT